MSDANELVQAAFDGRVGQVNRLLDGGADVNGAGRTWSPLHAAIDQSAQCEVADVPTDIIRLLLAAGAEPSPGLKVARGYKCRPVIQLLEAAKRSG